MSDIKELISISYTKEEIEQISETIQCEGGNITTLQVKHLADEIAGYPFVEDKYKLVLLNNIARMKDAVNESITRARDKKKYYFCNKISYVVSRGLSALYDEVGEIPVVLADDTLERRLAYLTEEIVVDSMLLDANSKNSKKLVYEPEIKNS